MNIEYAKNLKWADAEKTSIDLVIKFVDIEIEVPFSANPNDVEKHGRQIFADCINGKYGVIADYVHPVIPAPTEHQNKLKAIELLRESDWVNQPDVTDIDIDPHLVNYQDFRVYRLALRAIAVDPQLGHLNWPTKPVAQWS